MKLMTKQIENFFQKFPLYSQDGKGKDAKVVAHYFSLTGAEWLITEANKLENGDYEMFGYCKITYGEFGYVMLSQLEELGMQIERDKWYKPCSKTVNDFIKQLGLE